MSSSPLSPTTDTATTPTATTTMTTISTDRPLNTSYKVLVDIVDTNDASLAKKTVICLGTFDTILSFWQFWNGFKRKQTLKSLPKDVNLRVFRSIVQETTNPKEWCGETWSARLSSETDNQMTDAIIKICVQFASEQLSRMMNGVTFMRRSNGDMTSYNVEIWLEKGLPETVRRLNDILKKFCVDNSTTTMTHASRTSGRIATLKEPETRYRVKEFETFEKTAGVQKMPKDLLVADLQSLFASIPGSVVKTSRRKKKSKNKKNKNNGEEKGMEDHELSNDHSSNHSNHNSCNGDAIAHDNIENGLIFSLDRSISAQSTLTHASNGIGNSHNGVCQEQKSMLRLSTEKNDSGNHINHNGDTPMRNTLNGHTRMRSHTVGATTQVSQSLQSQVSRHFGNFQAYETTIVEKLDEKCQQALIAEGCPVCLRNEPLYESTGAEEKMDESNADYENDHDEGHESESDPKVSKSNDILKESWVIIKCKLLRCQHVMHLSCAPNVSDVTLRSFHCSSFFRTFTPRNDDDDFEATTNDHSVRQIGIRFRVTHLLSDKSGETIMDLTGIPTRWHRNSNKEYAMVTLKDEQKEFFIPIRRGRIVCDLEIPILNHNHSDRSNGTVHLTNGNKANGNHISCHKKMNRYDSNFEIPPPTYNLKSGSEPTPSQLPKHVLVLAESQDYVLQVMVAEVFVGGKLRLQLLSLRYIFTPPENINDSSNSMLTANHVGLNGNNIEAVPMSTNHNNHSRTNADSNGTTTVKNQRIAVHAPIHPSPSHNTAVNGQAQEMTRNEKKNADKEESSFAHDSDEDSIWVSNIKPRNDASTPSSSSARTQTPAPESANATPQTAGVAMTKTLNGNTSNANNSTARMKPLSLAATAVGKTLGTNNNSIDLNVRTNRNGLSISTAQVHHHHHKSSSQLTPNGLVRTLSNSPGLSSLASPYPSTMDSPAHQPMATLSLNSTSNHKFTPINANVDRPFMSPATMSIDHLMTQNGLTTSNLLIPMTNHINGNNSPFWLASTQTPSLPPLGNVLTSSVGLSSQQNYALNGDIILGGERSHDLAESHGINSIGNDISIAQGITGMTAAIGARSTGSHGLCSSNGDANYRAEYTTSPLSNKSSGVNNIMGVLSNSPSKSEKYTPFIEPSKPAATDKANKLMSEGFDALNLNASKMGAETIETPVTPDLTSLTLSTANTKINNSGSHSSSSNTDNNHTNPNLNTQLLTQLLSHPPFVNLLHQWGAMGTTLSASEIGVALRQQSNSIITSNSNNTANLGVPASVGTQSSQSYDYIGGVGQLANNSYGVPFQQPPRNFGANNSIYGVVNNTSMGAVHDMSGSLYLLSKTQEGSRMIQEKLHDTNNFAVIYNELCTHIAELMMDNCGHYVIEALFMQASDLKKLEMLKMIERDIGVIICHKQGSFSIQALMEAFTTTEHMEQFVKMLQLDVKKVILSNSGHFVILRYLQRYKYPWTRFIHKAIMNHMVEFATDHYGLRVLKTAIEAGPTDELLGVYNSVVKHTNALVENQYGNYIVQHLLEVAPREITDGIKEKMHGKFVRYAKQKFSSNVVEKCLRHSQLELKDDIHNPKDWNTIIVRELCSKAGDLISDKYGNYCLQTALQSAIRNTQLLEEFMRCCRPHLDNLRENVKTKWAKLLSTAIARNRQMIQSQQDIKAQ